ncbi:MAG: hypothetical protein N3A69_16670, partial [Leptospiraceae bacterium]|nr:hypothetical protein [Leptospiraceae bacterium]
LGELTGILKYSKNNLVFKLISNETPALDIELRGVLERRNPYYDLRAKFRNYPWKNKLIEFCGYSLLASNLDLDLSLQTSGNNFSDMLSRKSFNLEFEIRDFSWQLTNPQIASDFFIFKSSNWTTKGGFSGHGFEGYFRNLELFSSSTSFKGYGNTVKLGSFQFHFWGQNSGNHINWSILTNREEKCQFSLK